MKEQEIEKLTPFQEPNKDTILKVPNCTYANKIEEKGFKAEYFICLCNEKDCSLICSACEKECHKDHFRKIKVDSLNFSNPICVCGKNTHKITEEMDQKFLSNSERSKGKCYFSEIQNHSSNKGFYKSKINNKIICSLCVSCVDKTDFLNYQFYEILGQEKKIKVNCECDNHTNEHFLDFFIKNKNLELDNYSLNFNINIFRKIELFNEKYIQPVEVLLKEYNERTITNSFSFVNFAFLYNNFRRYNKKFFYPKVFFQNFDLQSFFANLKEQNLNDKNQNYFTLQVSFIRIIFDTYYKSHIIKNNNMFNLDSIINMGCIQRYFFLNQSKKFKSFHSKYFNKNKEKYTEFKASTWTEQEFEEKLNIFIDSVLDFCDIFIKQAVSSENLLDSIFGDITRIFKFLIKYNLISNEQVLRFFEIILDSYTYSNSNSVNHKDFENTSYYLLRLVLYYLIQKDDERFIKAIQENKIMEAKKHLSNFSFMCNEETDIVTKVLANSINKFNRTLNYNYIVVENKVVEKIDVSSLDLKEKKDLFKRALKFDYCMKHIFDILLTKEDFNLKNLENLKTLNSASFDILLNPCKVEQTLFENKKLKEIYQFIEDFSSVNRAYLDYDIGYLTYVNEVDIILKHLFDLIKDYLKVDFDLNKNYYENILNRQENVREKIENLQIFLKFTKFYKVFFEFFSIYKEAIKFFQSKSEYLIDSDLIKFVLSLFALTFEKNNENLALFMCFNIEDFITIFFPLKKKFFYFLSILNNQLNHSVDQYKFIDGAYFSGFLISVIKHIIDSNSSNPDKLYYITKIMKLIKKNIKFIQINESSLLSPLDFVSKFISLIMTNENEKMDLLRQNSSGKKNSLSIAFKAFIKKTFESFETNNIDYNESRFLCEYVGLLNELRFNGIHMLEAVHGFYQIQADEFVGFLNNDKFKIPYKLEIELIRYFELMEFYTSFEIQSSEEILQRFYKSNSEIYINYNFGVGQNYTFNEIQNIICNPQFITHSNFTRGLKYDNEMLIVDEFETISKKNSTGDFFQKIDIDSNIIDFKKDLITKYNIKLDFLINIFKKFDTIVNKIYERSSSKNYSRMKKFYFNTIVQPLYYVIYSINNQNILLLESIGKDEMIKLFKICASFLNSNIIIYEKYNLLKADLKAENDLNSLIELYTSGVFEKTILKEEISSLEITKMKNLLTDIKDGNIKYFQLKEIISIIKNNLNVILGKDNKMDEESVISNQSISDNNIYYEKIDLMIKKYSKLKTHTFDENLSLIKCCDSNMGNFKARKIILNYLKNKLFDGISALEIEEEKFDLTTFKEDFQMLDLNIKKVKYQNIYCIYYLNILLNNDSQKCQNFLLTSYSPYSFKKFLSSLIKNFIFGNFLFEIGRFHELNENIERSKLNYEILTWSLKFLQNLCEGHNKDFQNTLFNIYLSNDKLKTELKNFYFKEFEKNHSKNEHWAGRTWNYHDTYKSNASIDTQTLMRGNREEITISKSLVPLDVKSKEFETDNYVFTEENDDIEEEEFDNLKRGKKFIELQTNVDNDDNEDNSVLEKTDNFKNNLPYKPVSFPNFIFYCNRIILNNIVHNPDKNCEDVLEIYQKFSDLTVEIIQGTPAVNLSNFYKKMNKFSIFDSKGKITTYDNLFYFQFVCLSNEIKETLFDTNTLNPNLISIKFNLFFTLTNLLNSIDSEEKDLVQLFSSILEPKKLIELITKYLIVIHLNHIDQVKITDKKFNEKYFLLDLDKDKIDNLLLKFRSSPEIYEDDIYKLSAQIYLYLTILGGKFEILEANSIINNVFKEDEDETKKAEDDNVEEPKIIKKLTIKNNNLKIGKSESEDTNEIYQISQQKRLTVQSYNHASTFYKSLIQSIEFLIPLENEDKEDEFDWNYFDVIGDNSDDEEDDLVSGMELSEVHSVTRELQEDPEVEREVQNPETEKTLKRIYFIIDPKVFLISEANINSFFENADRSNATNKLKYLLNSLEDFYMEVKYKMKKIELDPKLKKLYEIDYSNVELANIVLSMTIMVIILGFLDQETKDSFYIFGSLIILELIQIIMNAKYLHNFYLSKYSLYVSKNKKKFDHEKGLSLFKKIELYILDSFVFNEEIYLLLLNMIIGIIVLFRPTLIGLFVLQLITVVKFSPTIQQIVYAFRIRVLQLLNMVGFLAILIYFYANISYFYYSDEFIKTTDQGYEENLCQSLAQCSITFFDHGVRSSGGIGDLLAMKSSSSEYYIWRYFLDMIFYITVILLLLNMINGVIVSTFSQIREDSTSKEEDKNNKCYICSIDRGEFEKCQIPFVRHTSIDHNYKTYIQFLIYLKFFNEKDMDSDQSYVIGCVKNKDIGCFPIKRALCFKDQVLKD